MILRRLHAKYFVKHPASVDLPALVPVFHRWIQEQRLGGLLIDVADYKHVHEGPGILLIGHEADYTLDLGRGRPGLLYNRKRHLDGGLRHVLRTALHQALLACHLLEGEPSLAGQLTFSTGEVEVAFPDRLQVPNEAASLELVRADLEAVLAELYGGANVRLAWVEDDPRQPFAVHVLIPDAPDLATLIDRLEQAYA